ncbi:MAG: chorismate synthase [Planctomycetota bacterium]|jgi:chorismate synthase
MLTFTTAGESHGKCLIAIVNGFPAGIKLDESVINKNLKRRQGGYGRGGRMQIESDRVCVLSGIRKKMTIGSPICLKIENKDFKIDTLPDVTRPRPGHADLPGIIKYGQRDVRNILERASARETAARVAVGALAETLLSKFNIKALGYVKDIGGINSKKTIKDPDELVKKRDKSKVYCPDKLAEEKMIKKINEAKRKGNSLGGVIEIMVFGAPPGLGGHTQWDLRLDGILAKALMSVQAIKGVEFGLGFDISKKFGSQAHDEIFYHKNAKGTSTTGGFKRKTNNAGGIEGGMSNGEVIIARAAMKPIPTLKNPLSSVDILTKKPVSASTERSDICAVPAASVVCEAVVAFEIARCFMEKFGGDSINEVTRNYEGYLNQIRKM